MIVIFIIAVIAVILDQITKNVISLNMVEYESIPVIKNFFYIEYIRNPGVAFGYSVPLWILIILTVLAVGLFIYLAIRIKKFKGNKWYSFSIGLMLGGTIGNFIDRAFNADHKVVDFLSFILYYPWFKDGNWSFAHPFAIFNIADACLNVGVFMLLIYLLFIEPKREKMKLQEGKKEIKEDEVVVIDNHE